MAQASACPPIEDHGVIGNLCTVAVIALDGTIGRCCLPRIDSPSIFGALLDAVGPRLGAAGAPLAGDPGAP